MKALGYAAAMLVVVALAASGCGGGSGSGSGGSNVAAVQYNGLPEDAWREYVSVVPQGTSRMTVTLSDMNTDGDLYVEGPGDDGCSRTAYGTVTEQCVFSNPAFGNWSIEVDNYGPGSLNYRLTVTLEPSNRVASLKLVAGSGSAVVPNEGAQVALTSSTVTELPQQSAPYLSAVKSILLQAHAHEIEGNVRISDASMEGKGQLSVVRADGTAEVDFRLKIRGNEQHSVLAQSTKPILLDPHSGVPQEGVAVLDTGSEGLVEVRFGSDTGTGADIQVVVEPGPVVRELSWAELTGHWQIELQTAGGISAGSAGLPD
jgi:hypothetical protein